MKNFIAKQFILAYLDFCPTGYDSFKLYQKIRWILPIEEFVIVITDLANKELLTHMFRFYDGTNFMYVKTFAEIPNGTLPQDIMSWVSSW